jgi:hypothetical protein
MTTRTHRLLTVAVALASAVACDLVDPIRPTPYPDTEIFGNLLEVRPDPTASGIWVATIRVGVPRALGRAENAQPTPAVAGGILAAVRVTSDTVVVVDDEPGSLDAIGPGTEVVVIPSPGTTTMLGEKEVRLEAAQLMDFLSYARWRLPKLPDAEVPTVGDPVRINSPGVEHAAVPLAGGRVLYFTARLRPPIEREDPWIGAARAGLRAPVDGEDVFERSFRTELGDDGWSSPELVVLPGTEDADRVQVTWVSSNELRCFATVTETDAAPWVVVAERPTRTMPWGRAARLAELGDGDAYDAVAMANDSAKIVFASTRQGGSDLHLFDPALGEARLLEPTINSRGMEWGARVGPDNELYFVRGDRQLRFRDGAVAEVRLPGPQRTILIEAAPTSDGAWLFVSMPRFRPMEFDLDIQVAPLSADGTVGETVPVDDWRPE